MMTSDICSCIAYERNTIKKTVEVAINLKRNTVEMIEGKVERMVIYAFFKKVN